MTHSGSCMQLVRAKQGDPDSKAIVSDITYQEFMLFFLLTETSEATQSENE